MAFMRLAGHAVDFSDDRKRGIYKREYARGACPMAELMIPLLAFAAWSGTGKKQLLLKKIDPGIMRQRIRPG